jgi:hypothetical protein
MNRRRRQVPVRSGLWQVSHKMDSKMHALDSKLGRVRVNGLLLNLYGSAAFGQQLPRANPPKAQDLGDVTDVGVQHLHPVLHHGLYGPG